MSSLITASKPSQRIVKRRWRVVDGDDVAAPEVPEVKEIALGERRVLVERVPRAKIDLWCALEDEFGITPTKLQEGVQNVGFKAMRRIAEISLKAIDSATTDEEIGRLTLEDITAVVARALRQQESGPFSEASTSSQTPGGGGQGTSGI
jgi:hypothetical protein